MIRQSFKLCVLQHLHFCRRRLFELFLNSYQINRLTFYRRKEKSKTLQKLLEDAEESLLDWAETKLISHIDEGDITSLLFFLKTKGKKRGYIEKVENDVSLNGFEELMRSLPCD